MIMSRWTFARAATVIALVGAALMSPTGRAALAAAASPEASLVNRGVVELETGGSNETAARVAADIVSIVDDGATRRVVPVIGKGPIQNLTDLKFLRGIDLAIVQSDALDYAREQRLVPGIGGLNYIAKLYNEEFHLVARPNIKTIADLANQTVNVDLRGSGTAVTTSRLFDLLKITITVTTDNQEVALQRLRKGEIAALALLAAKPAPLLRDLKTSDGLHLLSIPLTPAVTAAYVPARLTADDYPQLVAADQPSDTIAVASLLMAADLRMVPERYRNVVNFVEAFFAGSQSLLEPGHHPKWQEVNIAANVPGWVRYPPAEQWLQRNMQVATTPNPDAMKSLFSRFVDERRQAGGGGPMSAEDKDALFQQFRAWQRGQAR
jgi:TRAP-type uncharacterized transport system substrate-binding protein